MRRALLSFILLLLPSSAFAGPELSLLFGYRTGGPSLADPPIVIDCIREPCPEPPSAETRDGEAFGLVLDIPLNRKLMFEVLLSHQRGELDEEGLAFAAIYPLDKQDRFDLTYLHVGLQRRWQLRRLVPFAAVGLGIARVDAEMPLLYFETLDEQRLSGSLAGGLKIPLAKRLAIRLEGRGYWTDMPDDIDDFFQLELGSGIVFNL